MPHHQVSHQLGLTNRKYFRCGLSLEHITQAKLHIMLRESWD